MIPSIEGFGCGLDWLESEIRQTRRRKLPIVVCRIRRRIVTNHGMPNTTAYSYQSRYNGLRRRIVTDWIRQI
uniref:Uncharacterized protein n=1 Tax=Onchocerca volvulus TaxID=6282 RepID=A0A8R1TQV7_ONCVO